jgi:hypothetical protein
MGIDLSRFAGQLERGYDRIHSHPYIDDASGSEIVDLLYKARP